MLWAINIAGYELFEWQILVPLGVGVGVGLLSVIAFAVVGRRRLVAAVPTEREKKAQVDPFTQGSACELRRALRRAGHPVKVFLAAPGQETPQGSAWVLDRSVGGLCLSVEKELAPGTQLRVLPSTAPDMAYWVEVEVRSCRAVTTGFEVGCQFLKTPPWSILLLFG